MGRADPLTAFPVVRDDAIPRRHPDGKGSFSDDLVKCRISPGPHGRTSSGMAARVFANALSLHRADHDPLDEIPLEEGVDAQDWERGDDDGGIFDRLGELVDLIIFGRGCVEDIGVGDEDSAEDVLNR